MKTNSYFATGADMIEKIIAPLNFNSFMEYMPVILDLARGMSDVEGSEFNRRGYLTLMDGIKGEIAFTVPFGEIPAEKSEKYFKLSQEKATRLFSQVNMHLPNGHTTSFESRNTENEEYGGAIYINCRSTIFILSFSGMPELIDEAMMLVLTAKLVEDIGKPVMTKIEACKRNPYWKLLLEKFMIRPGITCE
jgi:hypothetical protein